MSRAVEKQEAFDSVLANSAWSQLCSFLTGLYLAPMLCPSLAKVYWEVFLAPLMFYHIGHWPVTFLIRMNATLESAGRILRLKFWRWYRKLKKANEIARLKSYSYQYSVLGMEERTTWQSSGKRGSDSQKLFVVSKPSDEFSTVESLFRNTLPAVQIDRIERIENGPQHRAFSMYQHNVVESVDHAFDKSTMIRMLFHGTRTEEACKSIINSDVAGFQPLLAGVATGAIWGDGTYFARDARYSDDYAYRLPSGWKQMLAAKVVVGRWTKGTQGIKICPLLPGDQYKRYDSLVNDESNPSIFVVQHSVAAYPAYLITYGLP